MNVGSARYSRMILNKNQGNDEDTKDSRFPNGPTRLKLRADG